MKNTSLKKNTIVVLFSVLILFSAILITAASNLFWGSNKIDLTSDKKYTLGEKSREIVKSLQKPVLINVYMSENLAEEYPLLAQHAQFVLRYLEKYRALNGDKITIEIKNPEPFTVTEEEAQNNGIRSFLDSAGKNNLYFGAQFVDSDGTSRSIPYFSLQRQNYLEHDISRILAKFAGFEPKTVGIASFVMQPIYQNGNTDPDDWMFVKQLKNDYNVIRVNNDILEIPSKVDVLILINPQNISKIFSYALDQYILRGGRLIVFLDPYSEYASLIAKSAHMLKSGMQNLLVNLGLHYAEDIVVGDKEHAVQTLVENKSGKQVKSYYPWFNTEQSMVNQASPYTKGLNRLNFRTPGYLEIIPKENVIYTRLFSTGDAGGHLPNYQARFLDKYNVINLFQPDNRQYDLGYLVEGYFESIYTAEEFAAFTPQIPYIIGSIEKSKVMVITDTDFLFDASWNDVEYEKRAGVYDLIPSASNADFILRAVDYMSGNDMVAGIEPSKLFDEEKTIGTQLHERVYREYAQVHKLLEEQLIEKQNMLNEMTSSYGLQSSNLTLTAVKNLENQQKEVQKAQNILNHLDYDIKKSEQDEINNMVLLNTLVFPFTLLLVIWILMKLKKRSLRKKALRDLNE